jgi:hypothetical protein
MWLLGLFLFSAADGSHHTLVGQESSGLVIILRHEAHGTSPMRGHDRSLGHEHCLAAKLITLLADDSSSRTDHIIHFAGPYPQLASLAPVDLGIQEALKSSAVPALTLPFPLSARPSFSLRPRPPPATPALLEQLRSTLLLI